MADYTSGLSPRAALSLVHAARAWALMDGRTHVVPEDVQAVLPGVTGHRLSTSGDATLSNADAAAQLVRKVAIP